MASSYSNLTVPAACKPLNSPRSAFRGRKFTVTLASCNSDCHCKWSKREVDLYPSSIRYSYVCVYRSSAGLSMHAFVLFWSFLLDSQGVGLCAWFCRNPSALELGGANRPQCNVAWVDQQMAQIVRGSAGSLPIPVLYKHAVSICAIAIAMHAGSLFARSLLSDSSSRTMGSFTHNFTCRKPVQVPATSMPSCNFLALEIDVRNRIPGSILAGTLSGYLLDCYAHHLLFAAIAVQGGHCAWHSLSVQAKHAGSHRIGVA